MTKRLLKHNPLTNTSTFFHYDEMSGEMIHETVQPTDELLDLNRQQFNDADRSFRGDDKMHKVASIPLTLFYQLKRMGIIDDPVALKRWLNDPDNMAFRTKPGVL